MSKKTRKILICGSKHWRDTELINSVLQIIVDNPIQTTVIHGGCQGADKIAGFSAKKLGCSIIKVLAEWISYGYTSDSARNEIMLKHDPDFVIAFHRDIKSSQETKDTLKKAHKMGIKTYVITDKKDLPSFSEIFLKDLD